MATKLDAGAELKHLQRRQQDLLHEQADLMARGEADRLRGGMTGTISTRLEAIGDELGGVLIELHEVERENGAEAVRQMGRDSEYQAALAAAVAVLQPLIALVDVTARRRGSGAALPVLPATLTQLVAEARGYLAALRRLGVLSKEV